MNKEDNQNKEATTPSGSIDQPVAHQEGQVALENVSGQIEPQSIKEPMPEAAINQAPQESVAISSVTAETPNTDTVKKSPLAMLTQLPKNIKILLGLFIFMFVIVILTSFTAGGKKVRQQITDLVMPSQSPIPTTAPVGENLPQSPYFSDQSVLALEEESKKTENDLNSVNLRDDVLRPPQLDWDVNFSQRR